MSRHTFTPGPWAFEPGNWGVASRPGWGLVDSDGLSLNVTVHGTDVLHNNDPHAEANARLIAAAPDLLEACQELMYEADFGGCSRAQRDAMRDRARAAIAQATETGETP